METYRSSGGNEPCIGGVEIFRSSGGNEACIGGGDRGGNEPPCRKEGQEIEMQKMERSPYRKGRNRQ